MRKLLIVFILAFSVTSSAQNIVGSGITGDIKIASTGYQGPGDVATGAFAWYSCARAYSASYATGGGSLCAVTRTSDSKTCTVVANAGGFAELTATNCNSSTQTLAQFCNATTCNLTTIFDQTGNSHNLTTATAVQLILNSTPTGTLPAIFCNGTTSDIHSTNITLAQQITLSAVYNADSASGLNGGFFGGSSATSVAFKAGGVNALTLIGTASLPIAATDNTWIAGQGLVNNTFSEVDNYPTTQSGSVGSQSFSSTPVNICHAYSAFYKGYVVEAGIWPNGTVNRATISSNQHDATSGYNF